jgi:hypothetical protein
MKQILINTLLIVSSSCFAQDSDNQKVIDVFFNYKKEIHEGNGLKAAEYLTNATLSYYNDMLIASLTMDSIKVQSLPIMDKYIVLATRHLIPASEVFKMQGIHLFDYLMSKGLSDKNSFLYNRASMQGVDLGDILVSEKKVGAIAQIVQCELLPVCMLRFDKENDIWKIDLPSYLKTAGVVINLKMRSLGLITDEYILQALEASSGKKPENTIWQPLK